MISIVSIKHLRSINVNVRWDLVILRATCSLGMKMKTLNDKKQFQEAIYLFNECDRKGSRNISDAAIGQALKSVTNIKDFKGGLDIYRRYSSRIEKNAFTLASIIHFHSK